MARHTIGKASNPRGGPNQQLCERCRPWDDLVSISSGNNPLKLGNPIGGSVDSSLHVLLTNTHCLICQALASTITARLAHEQRAEPQLNTHDVLVRNYGPYFLHSGYRDPSPADSESGSWMIDWSDPTCTRLRVIIKLDVFCSTESSMPVYYMTPQFCLRHSRSKPTTLVAVDPWEIPYFDTTLLRTWIDTCDGIHAHENAAHDLETGPLPRDFRVVDVECMKVTKHIEPGSYVALSYMWQDNGHGGIHDQLTRMNQAVLESDGGLGSLHLPPILLDAISLCRNLGERYLWIDRICIVQDDPQSKHAQISSMDTIYSSASFTIMAALNCRDGSAGLPGCPGRPRISSALQLPRACEGNRRGIIPVGLRQVVDTSEWDRRGWTFQERLLSRRRLFITDHQVIFQCSSGTSYEELSYLPHSPDLVILGDVQGGYPEDTQTAEMQEKMERRRQHRFQMPGFEDLFNHDSRALLDRYSINRYEIGGTVDMETYFQSVADYTTRHLTFPSDILNAFAGVANRLGKDLYTPIAYGLPERCLAQSLLWRCVGAAGPAGHLAAAEVAGTTLYIPSWSWASTGLPSDYSWCGGKIPVFNLSLVVSVVMFYLHDPETGLRMLEQEKQWPACEDISADEIAMHDMASGEHQVRVFPSEAEYWSNCPHSPDQMLARRTLDTVACAAARHFPGALVFNTTTAELLVDWQKMRKGLASLVAPATGDVVGHVSCSSGSEVRQRARAKFVVVGGGLRRYEWTALRTRNSFNRRFYILLVEPVPGQPRVVRRVEVGYVYIEMWKICQPTWETVVLS